MRDEMRMLSAWEMRHVSKILVR